MRRAQQPEASTGIRGAVKLRLVNDVLGKVPGSFKVLVTDTMGTAILNSAMRLHELMEHNVTLVESIKNTRQPLPTSPAIYFVSPTTENIDLIIKDWATTPMYQSAHIFFTSSSVLLLDRFQGSKAVQYIKTLYDVLIDFHVPQAVVYNFGWRFDLQSFFGPAADVRRIGQAAGQLASVLQSLGEKDALIRYQSTEVCAATAKRVHEIMESSGTACNALANTGADPATVLILDRSVDVAAPILHELSYQAMLSDLMPLKDNIYVQAYKDRKGNDAKRAFPLDEQDALWCHFRNEHISTCLSELSGMMKELLAQYPQFVGGFERDQTSVSQLGEAVRELPKFQEQQTKISMHMDITDELYKLFNSFELRDICDLEQRMVTGEEGDGSKCSFKELYSAMQSVMSDTKIQRILKFRLLLIFIVSQGSQLSKDKREELLHQARLGGNENHQIDNLAFLNVSVVKEKQREKSKRPTSKKISAEFNLSRYEPQCKLLLDQLIRDQLSTASFPYINPPMAPSKTTPQTSGAKSLRAGIAPRFASALTKGGGTGQAERVLELGGEQKVVLKNPSRVVLCILGGITDSEIRSVYELIAEHQREIIAGGTSILNPNSLLEQLPLIA